MVNKILTEARIPYKETRFLTPPKTTYAVYEDAIQRRGGDHINLLNQHDISLELYEYKPDPTAEASIEKQLDLLGLEFTKQPRYWIESEQLYQVIYEFTYYQKEDIRNVSI